MQAFPQSLAPTSARPVCGKSFRSSFCRKGTLATQTSVPITELARSDLLWVIENIRKCNGKPLRVPAFSHSIESDASSLGWGARYNTNTTGGRWSFDEAKHHINYLELLAAFHALQCFAPNHSKVCLQTDNSTVT